MPYELRPYQAEMLSDIHTELQHHRSVLAVLSTGGGKTVIFSKMGAGVVKRGKTVWFLAHRKKLVDQIAEKLLAFDVPHGYIQSGMPLDNSAAKVGMIQTVRNRLHLLRPPDLLVVDECHHVPSKAYAEVCNAMPEETSIVGFTGSPIRLDGKGLGHYFTGKVIGPGPAELISLGYLVRPKVFAPELIDASQLHHKMGDFVRREAEEMMNQPGITGDVIKHWRRHANGLSTLAFCVSIDHAAYVSGKFNEAGIPASYIHGGMKEEEIYATFAAFEQKKILFLASCDLVSEGVDIPMIEAIDMLRPTDSLAMYLQQVGRGLRTFAGKEEVIIIDHVGNTIRHRGGPDKTRDWSDCLEGGTAKLKKEDPDNMVIHTCPDCFYVYEGKKCPLCPTSAKPEDGDGRELPEEIDGELVEVVNKRCYLHQREVEQLQTLINKTEIQVFADSIGVAFETCRDVLIQRASTYEQLRAAASALGYKSGWARHRFKARGGRLCGTCGKGMIAIPDFRYQCTVCGAIEHASSLFQVTT